MTAILTASNVKRIVLPAPHPGQVAVRRQARRINVLAAGRRWRKTTLGMAVSAERAIAGRRWLWGAPTYDQVRVAWDELERAAGGVAEFRKSEMTVRFPWSGGRILFRSLDDPDNARGHTADGATLDESGDIPEKAWHEVVRPMLMDTAGEAWLLGTPRGHNWFWREFEATRDRDDAMAWQVPTLGVRVAEGGLVREPHPLENPSVPFDEIRLMHETMPERSFRQEVLAEFVEDSGGVFRGVMACATGRIEAPYPGTFAMGVDWGKSNDWTVLTLIDCKTRKVVDFDRFNQIDWHVQQQRLLAMRDRWAQGGASSVVVLGEANSIGDPMIEALGRLGVPIFPFHTTAVTKAELIEALALDIETKKLTYPHIPQMIAELLAYELDRLPSGMVRYSAPEGMHDDCVISLALANRASRYAPISEQRRDLSFTPGRPRPRPGDGVIDELRRARWAAAHPKGEQ